MIVHKYVVTSLPEFYEVVASIAKENKKIEVGCPLWFRGHPYANYNLIPSIMRKNDISDGLNGNETYGTKNLREDYRIQNYKARTFHIIPSKPSMKLEWQALYQHNLGKTRLMDWSESARTALSFALEAFIDPRDLKDLDEHRKNVTPTVWVLNPKQLNEKVYDFFSDKENNGRAIEMIGKAIESLGMKSKSDSIYRELNKTNSKSNYFSLDLNLKSDIEIDGILNLGVIDELRNNFSGNLKNMIANYEFNPFFYLCLRYYADALPLEIKDIHNILPPLAILHQYQSERIRAQRGVFTIFPNYNLSPSVQKIKNIGYDCRILENQDYIKECLYEIRILNPRDIARELIFSGERRTELYPENEYYVHTLEADKFFV